MAIHTPLTAKLYVGCDTGYSAYRRLFPFDYHYDRTEERRAEGKKVDGEEKKQKTPVRMSGSDLFDPAEWGRVQHWNRFASLHHIPILLRLYVTSLT
jgi:hypothetical protein